MRQIWFSHAEKGRITIDLAVYGIGNDLLLVLNGGSPHIGCLSLGIPQNSIQSICDKNHKDFLANEIVINSIKGIWPGTLAVAGGIHFEKITPREIQDCLDLCHELGDRLAGFLHSR